MTRTTNVLGPLLALLIMFMAACADDEESSREDGDERAPTSTAEPSISSSVPDMTTSAGADDASAEVLAVVGEPTDRYEDPSLWVCRGSASDAVCTEGLSTTVIAADGTSEVVDRSVADEPRADCFYVYPTVDLRAQPGNAVLADTGDMELMVRQQAAQFSTLCRVFAPLYEQATIGTYDLGGPEPPDLAAPELETAYAQVLDAFRWYMTNENDGRPIVLIGHSQGSHHLARLASELFDPTPELAEQLVMATLIGGGGFGVNVADGDLVGGTFETLPLCTSFEDTGCIVAYNSYLVTSPPTTWWAEGGTDGRQAACVNPAELVHEDTTVTTSTFDYPEMGFDGLITDISQLGFGEVTTQFISYPDAYETGCVSDGTRTWLEISPADPSDQRPQVPIENPDITAIGLGLHLVDYQLLAGDLLALTEAKIDAVLGT